MKRTMPLTVLLLCFVGLIGCSQEARYTEQTAAIDPALQPPEAETDMPAPPTPAPDADDTTSPADTEPVIDKPEAEAVPTKVELSDEQWKALLSDEEFYVLRRSGTERPGTGRYLKKDADEKGAYHCVGCGNKLYDAKHKFHSGCGWPSFFQETEPGALTTYTDRSFGMLRIEMRCSRCDGHLGHIFNDAPDQPTGMRHCVNGVALIFIPEGADPQEVIRKHREQFADK